MPKCWRCGGGKTITLTTTGTHVLPCPTCGGSGESPMTPQDARHALAELQHPVGPLATPKTFANELSGTGSRVA